MSRPELQRSVQQSVLDRLLDHDRGSSMELPVGWTESVQALKQSVRRDLEWLLNTRRIAVPLPEACEELRSSVYHFGIPDISSMSRDAAKTYARLQRLVEEAVVIFEPRLANVRVSLASEIGSERQQQLHFIIEGLLRMDPNPEHVAFDTMIEIASGEVEIRSDADAG